MGTPGATPAFVLIVEDERPIAQALSDIVEGCGYIPVVAANGEQALVRMQEHYPSVIITDLMMPLMNGEKLIAAVRERYGPQGNSPPIILMSAAGEQAAEHVPADVFLPKPFEITEVEALLRRYIVQHPPDERDGDDS